MHNNGKNIVTTIEHDKVNNIGAMKLLHHHSTGHKSKIKVQDYNTITKA
jgi:hypothetical protein